MAAGTVLADLPSCPGWSYGGFPYGLEPLTLPAPDEPSPDDLDPGEPGPDSAVGVADLRSFESTCRLVEQAADGTVPLIGEGIAADTVHWFRWITGHQVSFAVWRLMAWLLHDLRTGRAGRRDALTSLAHYVRGYGAMLRYSSSCPRHVYHDLIRPSMYRQHPGFSGGWAPDYRLVREVFRGRPPSWLVGPGMAELAGAVAEYQAEHAEVAARLVPGGRSLLQDSASARHPGLPQPLLGVLYDNYFMTLRAPVGRAHVVAQLLRRLLAVAQDLAVNPPADGAALVGVTEEVARGVVADLFRWHSIVPHGAVGQR